MPEEDPKASLLLERSSRTLENITKYSISSSFTTPTDGFSVELYEPSGDRSGILNLELEPVELSLNGHQQIVGRLDDRNCGANGLAVEYMGRDMLGDATECHADPTLQIKKDELIEDALLRIGAPVGVNSVRDVGDLSMRQVRSGKKSSGGAVPSTFKGLQMKGLKRRDGESIYQLWDRIVARHGTMIQPSLKRGEIVLDAPNYVQDATYSIRRKVGEIGSASNNIVSAQSSRKCSAIPTHLVFSGKFGQSAKQKADGTFAIDSTFVATELGNLSLASQLEGKVATGRRKPPNEGVQAIILEEQQLLYRLYYLRDESARDSDQLTRSASRAMSERLKDTLIYTCTLRGHVDPESGAIWSINTLVEVNDEVADVNETMWIESRTLDFDDSGGARTQLICWRLGALSL